MTDAASELAESLRPELEPLGLELVAKPWESGILDRNVFQFKWLEHRNDVEENWTQAIESALATSRTMLPCLFSVRLPASEAGARRTLENCGFRLIECYLEFRHELKEIQSASGWNPIREFRPEEIPELRRIAFDSFEFSRFHSDPEIDREAANRSRADWVENGCKGYAKSVLVAEVDGRPGGFLLARESISGAERVGILDLIGVAPKNRRKRLGWDLTVAFLRHCRDKGYDEGKVGTQAHNIASVRMYERAGFLLSETSYSYHKHLT